MIENNPFRPGSLAWIIADGDWGDMTIPEIAEAVSSTEENVSGTITYIRKATGHTIPYNRRTSHKPSGTPSAKRRGRATSQERHTALKLEAERLGLSYGQFAAKLSFPEEDRIVNAYLERKNALAKKKEQQCKGCSYYVIGSCSFHLTGRLRRRDAEGLCLEKTSEKRRRVWFGK